MGQDEKGGMEIQRLSPWLTVPIRSQVGHYLPFQLTQFKRWDHLFPRHVKEKVDIVHWILI